MILRSPCQMSAPAGGGNANGSQHPHPPVIRAFLRITLKGVPVETPAKKATVVKLSVEELESRTAPVGMPASEAWCAGGVYNSPKFQGIRFIQDPCNTIDHPFPF